MPTMKLENDVDLAKAERIMKHALQKPTTGEKPDDDDDGHDEEDDEFVFVASVDGKADEALSNFPAAIIVAHVALEEELL